MKTIFNLFSILFLTSCFPIISSNTELTLKSGENWELSNQFTISQTDAQLSGQMISQGLDEALNDMRDDGVDAEWEMLPIDDSGYVSYKITTRGVGYELLNDGFGEPIVSPDETSGKRIINFYLKDGDNLEWDALHNSFTLNGGKIISHNGNLINNGSVKWVDHSGPMEAQLTEKSGFSILNCIGFAFVICIICIAIFAFVKWKPKASSFHEPYKIPGNVIISQKVQKNFCPNCGQKLPSEAVFCPTCGISIKT